MSFTPQQALARVIDHREIFHDEMTSLMGQIMRMEISPVMIAAILAGLRVKKETIGEITAAASVLREMATPVEVPLPFKEHLVDVVGTGGDDAHTFNISTAAAFVVAAAGGRVAKHGGRGVSSTSGSADLLEALGANIELEPSEVSQCIQSVGFGFMYAPRHHPAMRAVAAVRREMAVRTIFNILGPLVNPAAAPNILMGVFHPDLVGIQLRVLQRMGARRALVVWGEDGLDEISLGAPTRVGELKDGSIREYSVQPQDFGLPISATQTLAVTGPAASRARVIEALEARPGAALDIVALNAGAALYVSGLCAGIGEGLILSRRVIQSGAALGALHTYVGLTQTLVSQR